MQRKLSECSIHHILDTGELGGGNLIALDTARLMRANFRESYVWSDHGPAETVAQSNGHTSKFFPQAKLRKAGKIQSRIIEWGIRRRLKSLSPGIAHLSSTFVHGLAARAFENSGLIRVAHVQIEDTIPNWRWALRYPPHAIITCAKFLVQGVRESLPDNKRNSVPIHVVPNATDPNRFLPGDKREAKLKLGFPPDRPLILMLANLAPHKGQHIAIEAMAKLKKRGIIAECRLAGTERGQETKHTKFLQQQIESEGLGANVQLLGHRTDAPDLLRAADIFLLPSTNEGLPISILEAQAAGVPVLAAPTAGVPEAIEHDVSGFLISATDAESYADKMALLLSNTDLARRIGNAGMERVQREYSWEVYSKRMLAVFEELATQIVN